MRRPLSVAWMNNRGEQSKTHFAYNLEQAACGQFLHENFHIVPEGFGVLCTVCPKKVFPPWDTHPTTEPADTGVYTVTHFQREIQERLQPGEDR